MPTITAAIDDYLLALEAEAHSLATVDWYRWHLHQALDATMAGLQVDQVEVVAIRRYLVDLRNAPVHRRGGQQVNGSLSPETIRGRIRALKGFFNWCQREYEFPIERNPMRKIKMPVRVRPEPKAISLEDLGKLFHATSDDVAGIRDRAVLAFLADSGCRAGGLLTLRLDDLYLDKQRAVVREKGDRPRAVPFSAYTAGLIQQWLDVRPATAPTVFCSLGTTPEHHGQRLTMSGLTMLLKRLKRKSGVTGPCNPHSFRHGFARFFLVNGGDIGILQQFLGHSSSDTTSWYYGTLKDDQLFGLHESPMLKIGGDKDGS